METGSAPRGGSACFVACAPSLLRCTPWRHRPRPLTPRARMRRSLCARFGRRWGGKREVKAAQRAERVVFSTLTPLVPSFLPTSFSPPWLPRPPPSTSPKRSPPSRTRATRPATRCVCVKAREREKTGRAPFFVSSFSHLSPLFPTGRLQSRHGPGAPRNHHQNLRGRGQVAGESRDLGRRGEERERGRSDSRKPLSPHFFNPQMIEYTYINKKDETKTGKNRPTLLQYEEE